MFYFKNGNFSAFLGKFGLLIPNCAQVYIRAHIIFYEHNGSLYLQCKNKNYCLNPIVFKFYHLKNLKNEFLTIFCSCFFFRENSTEKFRIDNTNI